MPSLIGRGMIQKIYKRDQMPPMCLKTRKAPDERVYALLFSTRTKESKRSAGRLARSSRTCPTGPCSDANRNLPCLSLFKINWTLRLQRLQTPSKRMTSVCFILSCERPFARPRPARACPPVLTRPVPGLQTIRRWCRGSIRSRS